MTKMDWYNYRVARRLCVSCGAEMPEGDTRTKCADCRKRYKESKEAKVIHHYDANKKLDQDAKAAFDAHMTYGKYVSMLHQKRMKGQ